MSADPFAAFVALTRSQLTQAGLERRELGDTVYFISDGVGENIVLSHGVNDQAGTWSPVVASLAETSRLIVPDLAGHGESGPGEGPVPMSLIVERLGAVIEHEVPKGERVTLVGNSMGGWISMLYALEHPSRVARLVLENASGIAWPLKVPLIATSREDALVMLRAVHGPEFEPPEWTIDALLARAKAAPLLRVNEAGVMQYLLDGRLQQLHVPTTLIWGADDGMLPLAYGQALQRKIAGAQMHVIDGAAHIPHRQQPERFLACLQATS